MTTSVVKSKPGLLYRFGLAGFLFFLIKGLLWIAAPLVFVWFA